MPSRYFADEPKAIIALELRNRNAGRTAKDVVTSALLSYVSELKLNQLSYQASVAGMGINISDDDGLNISVSGYSQHLPELLTTAVTEYQSFTPSASELAQAKSWYREQVAVSDNGKAYEMAMRPFSRLKSVPYFEDKERLAALDTITESDITQYRNCLIREGALQMFVFGNLTAPQAEQIASKAQAQLGSQGTEWWVGDYYVIDKALKPNFDEKPTAQITRWPISLFRTVIHGRKVLHSRLCCRKFCILGSMISCGHRNSWGMPCLHLTRTSAASGDRFPAAKQ